MKRLLRYIVLGALVTGLVACGPARKSVFPPSVSIQSMTVQPDGQWRVTVRIQNNSYKGMDFHSINGELKVTHLMPVRLHSSFDLDIPPFAADVVRINLLPTAEMAAALQAVAAKGSAGGLAYSVSGTAMATPEKEKKARNFHFQGNDWLSPTPGIANTWR